MRQTRRLIARRLPKHEQRWGNRARHEWLNLARDDIGTWEVVAVPCYTELKN